VTGRFTQTELSLGIVGSGGDGVVLLGELLARAAVDSGVHCFMDKVFGPQIRGGESSINLRISESKVLRSADELAVLLVFQWRDLARFGDVLSVAENALVICPIEDDDNPHACGLPEDHQGQLCKLPLKQLALEEGKSKQARNMVLLGAVSRLLDWYPAALGAVIDQRMQRYDERSRSNNMAAYQAGRTAAEDWETGSRFKLPKAGGQGRPPSQASDGSAANTNAHNIESARAPAGEPGTEESAGGQGRPPSQASDDSAANNNADNLESARASAGETGSDESAGGQGRPPSLASDDSAANTNAHNLESARASAGEPGSEESAGGQGRPPSPASDGSAANTNAHNIESARASAGETCSVESADGQGRPPSQAGYRLASGNELLAEAALAAGCRFMAGYPITPASEILEYMSRRLPALGGTCIQAEDEMAAACLTIGAALGGVRSMSATSGPGMTLKSESIALAGMAGLPMVVVDVQRCGPSTGIPTRTEQADLNLALYGAHGDSPRIVLAAAHAADCADLAGLAFELAGDCRAPVVLLSEQQIAQGLTSVAKLEPPASDEIRRWPDSAIGAEQQVQLTGLEHDTAGRPLSDAASHESNASLRQSRVDAALGRVPALHYGPGDAKLGLLCWGSSYAVCCEAAGFVNERGGSCDVLCLRMLAPLDTAAIERWLALHLSTVIVEMNHSGQLWHYLRGQLALPAGTLSLRRSGGRPWRLQEITDFLLSELLMPEEIA
jgi:pyruvate/2-oxoacid:ferredoxin oxidoreductase alpha subunit/Pyruvate/2-oxoacid:ferredoxin oxidoreductase gamma subunit